MCAGTTQGITITLNLYMRPRRYSQHCFIAINTNPKLLYSTLFFLREDQYTKDEFRCTRNPVLDRLVTVSDASNFALIINPSPWGWGTIGGISSVPCIRPNSLEVRSFSSKSDSSTHGLLVSKNSSVLWYLFRYAKMWNTWLRCPYLGRARFDNIIDHSRQISTLSRSTIHRKIPIKYW